MRSIMLAGGDRGISHRYVARCPFFPRFLAAKRRHHSYCILMSARRIDLTGNTYGQWTVLGYSHANGKDSFWLTKCKCGNESTVRGTNLKSGNSKSCGCGRSGGVDISGNTYGRLTVLARFASKNNKMHWHTRCQCGTESIVSGYRLRTGRTQSCGCLKKERLEEAHRSRRTHAETVRLSGLKHCRRRMCAEKNPQPIGNFSNSKSSLSGLKTYCKSCESSYSLKSRIGITGLQKNQAIASQKGKCANPRCERPADHADHNHETGRFRAVLCGPCNRAEGLLKDPDRIRGLLEYRLHHDAIDYPDEKIT